MSKTWESLQEVLKSLGHEPKKSLGQNFLISDSVIEKIIKSAQSFGAASVIEIGPGPGALTQHLRGLSSLSHFELIELDRNFAKYWREQGLSVNEVDALQFDWSHFLNRPGKRILVSNLPYQISSSIVIDRSIDEKPLEGMVLMFQKEVAQRIKAPFENELYGMLSVVSQTFWNISTVSEAGPRDFFPPPRIASRVLQFTRKANINIDSLKYFKLVKACFMHPRKLMVSNMEQAGICSKIQATEWILGLGLEEKVRAEALKVADFLRLYDIVYPQKDSASL